MIAFLRKVKKVFTEKIQSAKVYLYEEDFINIRDGVSHSVPHPEIETDFDKVEKAIENPNFVSEDPDYKRKCYYLSFSGRGDYINQSMRVVVGRAGERLIVINAYFVYRRRSNEKIIWP